MKKAVFSVLQANSDAMDVFLTLVGTLGQSVAVAIAEKLHDGGLPMKELPLAFELAGNSAHDFQRAVKEDLPGLVEGVLDELAGVRSPSI